MAVKTKPLQDKSIPEKPTIEIVLKCDSIGSVEAVTRMLSEESIPGMDIIIVKSGVGAVNKSDIMLAETAGRLIVGFQVGVVPGLERTVREHGVEVRLYDVIYRVMEDFGNIALQMTEKTSAEEITGSAKIIALFKSTRKGIILGCEVTGGFLALGQQFRIISVIGPIYSGTIESLHSGEKTIQKAVPGQQIGLKIKDFNRAHVGDLVESFRPPSPRKPRFWKPSGAIIRK